MISDLTPAEQEQLNSALQAVVRRNVALDDVLDDTIKGKERQRLAVAIGHALGNLDLHNCDRYGLTTEETRTWIEAGRPAGFSSQPPEPDFSEDPGAVMAISEQKSGKLD